VFSDEAGGTVAEVGLLPFARVALEVARHAPERTLATQMRRALLLGLAYNIYRVQPLLDSAKDVNRSQVSQEWFLGRARLQPCRFPDNKNAGFSPVGTALSLRKHLCNQF
jgi:hypothetical protein